jgi:hypothetical protein
MEAVAAILARDFSGRYSDQEKNGLDQRLILSTDRSMGSVIKLLTPVQTRLQRRLQRVAERHSATYQGAGLRRQALPPPGMGR